MPVSTTEEIRELEKPLVKSPKKDFYSIEHDMQTGKLQKEIEQYKKMLHTLDPKMNLPVNTNPINQALSSVNIIRKRGGTSGHQKLVDGRVVPTKQYLMKAKLEKLMS